MALSNPPAGLPAVVPQGDSPMARLDDAVIRLRIGETTYGVPLRDLGALLDASLPAFVTGQGDMNSRQQALRSAVKAILPMGLRVLGSDVEQWSRQLEASGGPSLPLPDLKARHRDMLDYTVRYLAALILTLLSSTPWEATCGETVAGPDGYIRLSGLSGGVAPRPDGTPAPDAGPDAPDDGSDAA